MHAGEAPRPALGSAAAEGETGRHQWLGAHTLVRRGVQPGQPWPRRRLASRADYAGLANNSEGAPRAIVATQKGGLLPRGRVTEGSQRHRRQASLLPQLPQPKRGPAGRKCPLQCPPV